MALKPQYGSGPKGGGGAKLAPHKIFAIWLTQFPSRK